MYDCTITYGTCESFGSLYSFQVNVYRISYLPVLLIKVLINKDGDPTTPFKLATGTKSSVSHLCVIFCLCVVRKATAHVGKKALNMRHQAQKGFCGIFVGIPQHQKGYIVYIPHTQKIISSYDVDFDDIFSIALEYTSQPNAEAMDMRLDVSYIHYATYSRDQTGDIITFTQFEEGDLLSETCDDTESSNKYYDDSTLPPFISEEEIDAMSSGRDYDAEPMSKYMLEDISDGNQFTRA